MNAFDPRVAPEPADIVGRGTRLATVASVLSMVFAEPLTAGLRENLHNTELLELWPLRDSDSLAGVAVLKNATDTSKQLSDEWLELFGYGGAVSLHHPNAAVEHLKEETMMPPVVGQLPATHLSVGIALCGSLAAVIASLWRDNERALAAKKGEAIATILEAGLDSSAEKCTTMLESTAHATTFRALAPLTRGFFTELRSFARACRTTS